MANHLKRSTGKGFKVFRIQQKLQNMKHRFPRFWEFPKILEVSHSSYYCHIGDKHPFSA